MKRTCNILQKIYFMNEEYLLFIIRYVTKNEGRINLEKKYLQEVERKTAFAFVMKQPINIIRLHSMNCK